MRKRRLLAGSVASLILAAGAGYVELTPPVYSTRAIMAVEAAALGPGSPAPNSNNEIQAQLEILTSQSMAARVARRLGWETDLVIERVSLRSTPSSNLIKIFGKAPSPDDAVLLVESYVKAWPERDLEVRSAKHRRTLEDLQVRHANVSASLQRLEEQQQEFLESHPMAAASGALATELADLGQRRQELLKKFTPEHPEAAKLAARGRELESRLSRQPEAAKDLQRIIRELRIQEDLYGLIARQMEEARIALATIVSPLTLVSGPARPESPSWPNRRQIYQWATVLALLGAVAAVIFMESQDLSLSTIEDIEKNLKLPVLSVIPRWSPAGRGRLAGFWRSPRPDSGDVRSHLLLHEPEFSERFNPYHRLRTSAQALLKPGPMVLTLTSAGTNEGKTLTAINFCLASARAGLKTLLVGLDMHRGSLQRIFNLPEAPGLADILNERIPWRQALRSHQDLLQGSLTLEDSLGFPGIENFHVLPGTGARDHAYGALSETSISSLMRDLRAEFDLVVIDCPPAILFGEVLVVARNTDGVVLVYRAGILPEASARLVCEHLLSAQARILGIVLNDASLGPPEYYYYASSEGSES